MTDSIPQNTSIAEPNPQFMREAIALSLQSVRSGQGGPFGAVIVKDGVIIATGNNQVTSTNDPTAHAEVVAIRSACKTLNTFQLKGCEIYTSCEPCPMCLGAIYWARPDRVYYGNTKVEAAEIGFDDQFIYDELELPLSERKLPMIQLLSEEAIVAFQEWAAKLDKIEY
ncbi:MAG: nucleoside deaminase [Leptolyngbyaceae cyanobacterium HOT.MB2.61]|nr:nucleoside deaminase [Leptolyngbyaceae cyanobacterium HOT.MB2.61]